MTERPMADRVTLAVLNTIDVSEAWAQARLCEFEIRQAIDRELETDPWRARAEEAERTLAELTLALDRVLETAKKRREAKVKPPKEKREVYVVPMRPLAEVQRAIGELDGVFAGEGTRSQPMWRQLAEALALVRAISQGASVAEYRASECAHLHTMLKAYRPSQIARAISWAGRDKRFWANKALLFHIVAREIPGWLAAADQGRTMTTRGQEIDDTRAQITAMAREIYTMAPLVAHEITEALRADRPDLVEIHAKATKELARLRKKNDKHATEGTPR